MAEDASSDVLVEIPASVRDLQRSPPGSFKLQPLPASLELPRAHPQSYAEAALVFATDDGPVETAARAQDGIVDVESGTLRAHAERERHLSVDSDHEDADDSQDARLPDLDWRCLVLQNPSRSIRGLLEYARRKSSSGSIHLTISRPTSAENAAQSDEEHELTKQDRVQILWAKALWYATQEATRRRGARIQLRTKQRLSSSRGKILRKMSLSPSHRGSISRAASQHAGDHTQRAAEDQVDEPRHHEFDAQEPGARTNWNRLSAFLDGIVWSCLTILSTIWVLGGNDIYILSDPPLWADKPVYSLYVISFFQVFFPLVF